jgi:segregation and condensation protein B
MEIEDLSAEERTYVKRMIEALLFASSEPLPFAKLREVISTYKPIKPGFLRKLIDELQRDYRIQQRAYDLDEIAQGFLLRTREEFGKYIELLHKDKRSEKLTQASAEVLAIIAYKQPVTRPEIDKIRGVDSSGIIQNLLDRELVEMVGKLEAPGRPTLYSITKNFLKHFGLKDLKDLPPWSAILPN